MSAQTGHGIPFSEINQAAMLGYPARLQRWFPAGRMQGREFVVGDLSGTPGHSLSINTQTGAWKDFGADGEKGGSDPVSLFAAAFHNGKQGDAAKALAQEFGIAVDGPAAAKRSPPTSPPAQEPAERWWPTLPPPDAPDPSLDRYDSVWTYRDAAGIRIGYVVRLDPNERCPKKMIHGITWGRRIWIDDKGRSRDETGWHHKHPARPMQLYGLDRLAARPEAPVIITEGEKACDAATAMFLDHVCVTWPRGGENVPYADWTALAGRSVIIWPDNDPPNRKGVRPGLEAARKVAEQLRGIAASVRTLRIEDLTKGDQPDGEDAADIAIDDPAAWLAAHLPTPDDDPSPYGPDGPAKTQPLIRSATAAHISFIHHSGKDANRGARGWSGLRGAIDTEIEVTEDNGTRRVQIKKQRDLDRAPDFSFTLETVELGVNRRGKPVQSCIVRPIDQNTPAGAPADPARSVTGDTRRAYELLRDLTITDGLTGYAGMPAGVLSVTDDAWREVFYSGAKPGAAAQARRRAFQRAGEKLIELKMIGMSGGRVWVVRRPLE